MLWSCTTATGAQAHSECQTYMHVLYICVVNVHTFGAQGGGHNERSRTLSLCLCFFIRTYVSVCVGSQSVHARRLILPARIN